MVKINPENLEKSEKLLLDFDQLHLHHYSTPRKNKTCFENLKVWTLMQYSKLCHTEYLS